RRTPPARPSAPWGWWPGTPPSSRATSRSPWPSRWPPPARPPAPTSRPPPRWPTTTRSSWTAGSRSSRMAHGGPSDGWFRSAAGGDPKRKHPNAETCLRTPNLPSVAVLPRPVGAGEEPVLLVGFLVPRDGLADPFVDLVGQRLLLLLRQGGVSLERPQH